MTHQYEEVKETVETVKEGVGEALNWRDEFENNPLVWGAGAVSIGILIGFGIAHAFDDDDEPRGRVKKTAGRGERLVGNLGGLADVVLPTISAKVKEMFGLDLDAYLRAEHERGKPARKKIAARQESAAQNLRAEEGRRGQATRRGQTQDDEEGERREEEARVSSSSSREGAATEIIFSVAAPSRACVRLRLYEPKRWLYSVESRNALTISD